MSKKLRLSELSEADLKSLRTQLSEIDPEEVDVVKRYTHLAPVYDELVEGWEYQCPYKGADILQNYVRTDEPILDAGCGTGLVGQELVARGYRNISGIDISPDMLSQAEATGHYLQLHLQDLTQPPFPFPDNSFAAITCMGVFFLIADPTPVLREFCRLVRPQGYLLFTQHEVLFKEYGYDKTLLGFEQRKELRCESISAPMIHLPKRDDYDRKVIYCVYQVVKI